MLSDPEQARAERESPIAGAVDLAAHTRDLQQGTAPCSGCQRLQRPGGENDLPREHEPAGRE